MLRSQTKLEAEIATKPRHDSTLTLVRAAEQVGVSPKALAAYMNRMGITAATVYEVSKD